MFAQGQRARTALLGCAGLTAVAIMLAVPTDGAQAQTCESNLAEIQRAQADSEQALARITGQLDAFAGDLAGPRSGPLTADAAVEARVDADAFLAALDDFRAQAGDAAGLCGAAYAQDLQELDGIVAGLQAQRDRADRLIGDYNALVAAGEPPLSGSQIRDVQIRLAERGLYSGAISGTLNDETRAAIRAYQSSAGFDATGYLTTAQLERLLSTQPEVAQPAPPPANQVVTLQTCNTNLANLQAADNEADELLRRANSQLTEFETALRGARQPTLDAGLPAQISRQAGEVAARADRTYQQAVVYERLCGPGYDSALERVLGRVIALQQIDERADQLAGRYDALVATGEPAMTPTEMRQIQQALRDLDYYNGAVDAVFGRGTRSAIEAFQRDYGFPVTGYITLSQRDRLLAEQNAANRRAPTPPPVAAAPAPEPDRRSLPAVDLDEVAAVMSDAGLATDLPPELRRRAPDDAPFEQVYDLVRDLVEDEDWLAAYSQRYRLFGAAYWEAGPDSATMVDAHLLMSLVTAGLDDPDTTERQLEIALDLLGGLPGDFDYERAWILQRQAAIMLADAVASAGRRGSIRERQFQAILEPLDAALEIADNELRANDPLTRRIIDTVAAAHVAANVDPDDERIWDSIERTFD